MITYEAISKNIKLLRGLYGYSQQYIADFLHISKSTYSAIETGKSLPDFDMICNLSFLYDIDANYLISTDISVHILSTLHADYSQIRPSHFIEKFLSLSPSARDLIKEEIFTLYDHERGF